MHIQSINNYTPNFNGRYSFQGPWSNSMREIVVPFLEELAKGDKEIIAKMSTKRAFFDGFHHFGQKLYKPTIIAKQENLTFLEIVKDMVGLLPTYESEITSQYHRLSSTLRLLKERLVLDKNILWRYCKDLHIK